MAETRDLTEAPLPTAVQSLFTTTVSVDGQEIYPVVCVAGGYGKGSAESDKTDEVSGSGASGLIIPLGIYTREGDRVRFRHNPIVTLIAAIPVALIGSLVVRAALKTLPR